MTLSRFAFIVKGPGYAPADHVVQLNSPLFRTQVVGVSNTQDALLAAHQLIAEGVQLIELCGGFTSSEAEQLRDQTQNRVPIGVVTYDAAQAAEIERLFG